MNPGQTNRRFIFMAIGLGLLGAILVYIASSGGGSSGGGAGDIPVVVAKTDIPARTAITQSMIEVRLVTENDRSALAYATSEDVIGQVTRFPIAANEQVLSSKVVALTGNSSAVSRSLSFVVPAGKRGFSITASEVQNAGGLIIPGDYVDVFVVYDVEFTTRTGDREEADAFLVQILLQNIEVLAIAQTVVDVVREEAATNEPQRVRNSEARPDEGAATVTLALTPEQAQRIYLAEENGRVRLALRPFGESDERPIDYMTELELFPQNLPNPFLR
jgi:pilus assembly protein CpaB